MKKIFNFFKRNKKIEFQCLIPGMDPSVLYPPVYSSQIPPPDWYKERAKIYKKQLELSKCPFKSHPAVGDIVRCPGIKDLINSGITVRMWADFFIDLPKSHPTSMQGLNYGWGRKLEQMRELMEYCSVSGHHYSQFPNLFDKGRTYPMIIKFPLPWKVKAPRGVAFYMLPIYYGDQNNFAITPGVYDTTYVNQLILNVQVFMQEGRLLIPAGTPMCKLIPFYKKDKFDISITSLNKNESTALSEKVHLFGKFKNDYETMVKEREKMFDLFTD